jgi:hypothetical protein
MRQYVIRLLAVLCLAVPLFADCSWVPITGTSSMYTDSCTKVGIGTTTSPADALHVKTSSSHPALRFEYPTPSLDLIGIFGQDSSFGTYMQCDTYSNGNSARSSPAQKLYLNYTGTYIDYSPDASPNNARTWQPMVGFDRNGMFHKAYDQRNTFKMTSTSNYLTPQPLRLQLPFYRFGGMSMNADWNGSQWTLDDTSFPGWMIAIDNRDIGDAMRVYRVSAGSNPRTTQDVLFELENDGDLTVAGALNANGGQDLAEWVPATTKMEPGTVVVLNRTKTNEVMPSSQAYDTKVAGVVSSEPGLVLGVGGASKAMIATSGRVKVRVDATRHPIEVGDLLVTSDESGTAMLSVPVDIAGVKLHRPGTLIGKALEPKANGVGEILVLLSLQ